MTPAPALAASYAHLDPAHDVQQESSHGTFSGAHHQRTADIVRVRIDHTRQLVRVAVNVRTVGTTWDFGAQVRTPIHRYTVVGARSGGSTRFTLASASTSKPVICPGLSHHVVAKKGKIAVTIPTSCIAKPRWVQANVAMLVAGADGTTYVDDGLRRGGFGKENHPTWSPQVRR